MLEPNNMLDRSAKNIDKNCRNLRRRKWYQSPGSSMKFRVLHTERVGNDLHMLGRSGKDYAVFSFTLAVKDLKKHVPSDKFTWGRVKGEELFRDIVDRSKELWGPGSEERKRS